MTDDEGQRHLEEAYDTTATEAARVRAHFGGVFAFARFVRTRWQITAFARAAMWMFGL